MTDHVRAETARRSREEIVVSLVPRRGCSRARQRRRSPDDTLELLFMCCHPALSPASAIALTLRAVGGLTTAEIARAFLVPEATMAQRISRAKQTIKTSGVAVRDAARRDAQRAPRRRDARALSDLQRGLHASSGAARRTDLSGEAIRLTRMLHRLVPDEPRSRACSR